MNKLILVMAIIALGAFAMPANALSTIVPDVYSKSFTVELPDASLYLPSCNIIENYEAGKCSYVYGCYAILPKGSSDIDHAVQRSCVEMTDSPSYTYTVTMIPPKGKIYAVTTFSTIVNYTYNYVTTSWDQSIDIPTSSISAEEIISLCPDGYMLKSNLCIPALKICIDKLGTNLCTNPYTLYALDYDGDGFVDTSGEAQKDHIRYGLGTDFVLMGWDVALGMMQWIILDYEENLIQAENDTSFNLFLRREFPSRSMTAQMLWIYLSDLQESYMKPKIFFQITNNFQIAVGMDLFDGRKSDFGLSSVSSQGQFNAAIQRAQFLGNFHNNDRVFFDFKYSF